MSPTAPLHPDRSPGDTVRAPAKLTLSLRITGVREDGYHLIDAEMVTLALADVLTFTPGADDMSCDGPFAAGVPLDDANLVRAALRSAGVRAGVHLRKEIPHGGGLGGGSADAAAALRWAGVTDLDVAARIGADVPFCVVGGRARVRGIGEVVDPLPPVDMTLTLVIPPLQVSTPAAYAAWDRLGGPRADGPNDLEPAAIAVEPALAEWRDKIADASGQTPVLAGSGATWFLHGDHGTLAASLPDATVVVTRTG